MADVSPGAPGEEEGPARAGADRGGGAPWTRDLLEHLRPAARDPRRVVDWLGAAVGGTAALGDHRGGLLAGRRALPEERLVADLAAGRLASAAVDHEGQYARLVAVGRPPSAHVLTVWRDRPFDQRAAEVVAATAWVLDVLLEEREREAERRRLTRATADLGLAVLQLLMVGDTVAARRVAAGMWPGLLDADGLCVYVLEGPAGERERLRRRCAEVTGGRALIVRCPAEDRHLIMVAPHAWGAEAAEDLQEDLRALADGTAGVFLGGSVRQELGECALAYGQAVNALLVARFRPEAAAMYAERTHPQRLMPPDALYCWADRLLLPLGTLPLATHAELQATTRLGLEFTAVKAAKVLGVSRNTVRARMERTGQLLGADLGDLRTRAVVHLALSALADGAGYTDGGPREGPGRGTGPGLGELLRAPHLGIWARELLDRLAEDSRDLRGTLRAWISAGANAERAAQELGVHVQTVREHVRAGERALERRLLAGGSDLYEVVLAYLAARELEEPELG
ncbi:helix-turn-helix domain-containing protein [Streptomyces griseoaurantiacus]|uniref:helix-turn-helix domain-containing protein n=1 Tax=Streptomyces griseoaurantiacus TaxID=68213 RepID=UPI0019BE9AA8|nr:DNA-binding protein [Streptomyces griseoaurantiacus]